MMEQEHARLSAGVIYIVMGFACSPLLYAQLGVSVQPGIVSGVHVHVSGGWRESASDRNRSILTSSTPDNKDTVRNH